MNIPSELDGAKVILCTDNKETNYYGYVRYEDHDENVTALAIAKYANGKSCYLFSCDLEWNVIGDTSHSTLEEAKYCAENSAGGKGIVWITIL